MKHITKHSLDVAVVRQVMDRAAQQYTQQYPRYNPTFRWENQERAVATFCAMGKTLEAHIELQPGQILVTMNVPLLLRPFQKTAMSIILAEMDHWLDLARNGQLPAA